MEFLSERILRLAGLEDSPANQLNEGLSEEAVETHKPYQTEKTTESAFYVDEDEDAVDADHHKVGIEYAIKESQRALIESRLRDAIRAELKSILEETDANEEAEGLKYGASGYRRVKRSGSRVNMGGVGIGFKNWNK